MDDVAGCLECETGTYSPGDTTSSCTNCSEGKTSEQGTASQESDCTWGKLIKFYLDLSMDLWSSRYRKLYCQKLPMDLYI